MARVIAILRYLLSIVAWTSLVLAVATIWCRAAVMVPMGSDLRRYGLAADAGRLYLRGEFDITASSWPRAELVTHPAAYDWWFLDDRTLVSRTIAVPLWAPALAGLALLRLTERVDAAPARGKGKSKPARPRR